MQVTTCDTDLKQVVPALINRLMAYRAKRIGEQLCKAGHQAASLQGNLSQSRRQAALDGFRNGSYRILVATDIAARGLDIDQLPHVVNFELPNVPEDYVHRNGRTGRAGKKGRAITLACETYVYHLSKNERKYFVSRTSN